MRKSLWAVLLLGLFNLHFAFAASVQKATVYEFYAPWCHSCRALAPKLEKLEKEEGIHITRINVDNDSPLVAKYRVDGVPTMVVVKGDTVLGSSTGNVSYDELKDLVAKAKN